MRTSLAVAALAVATAVGGCGSDDNGNGDAPAPTTDAVNTTAANVDPEALAWAKEFCGALSSKLKPITPPNMQSTTPAAQQAAIVSFFGTVVQQQGEQLEAFKTVGPPPGTSEEGWKKAQRQLKKTRKAIEKLTEDLKTQHPKSASDVKEMLAGLQKQMVVLAKYQGPVAELQKDEKLAPALAAVPSCATTR